MNALLTDLYQLTMAAGYFQAGKTREMATFELYVRKLPLNRNYVIAAGLAQAVPAEAIASATRPGVRPASPSTMCTRGAFLP